MKRKCPKVSSSNVRRVKSKTNQSYRAEQANMPSDDIHLQQIAVKTAPTVSPSVISKQTVKCKNFLSALLRLASENEPESTIAIHSLIQDLVNAKLEPDEFANQLELVLQSSTRHTDFIPLLKVNLITFLLQNNTLWLIL